MCKVVFSIYNKSLSDTHLIYNVIGNWFDKEVSKLSYIEQRNFCSRNAILPLHGEICSYVLPITVGSTYLTNRKHMNI